MKKYTVEMTESEYKKLKELLKEHKSENKTKKQLDESIKTKPTTLYKITSFEAAKKYAKGNGWSLSNDENAFDHYTEDYDYYILYLDNNPEFAIVTTKGHLSPVEIRDAKMKKWDWYDELLPYLKSNGYAYMFGDGLNTKTV